MASILGAGVIVGLWARSYVSGGGLTEPLWLGVQVASFLLIFISVFFVRRTGVRQKWWTHSLRSGLVAVLPAGFFYLKWDAPVSPAVARNQAALAGRNVDEATFQLTLRYTPAPGGGQVFKAPKNKLLIPSDEAKRRDYLIAHRAEIEANWAELDDVRTWWSEMASHDFLGDRSTWSMEQPHIRFGPVKAYYQNGLALAELQAIDGDGDGALAIVINVYKVGANLESSACTLVRGMIAVSIQKEALNTARFVLDNATVSAVARERFAVTLSAAPAGGSGLKQMLLSEAMYASAAIQMMSRFSWRHSAHVWSDIFSVGTRWLGFNPQDTINRIHEQLEQISIFAGERELEKLTSLDAAINAEQLGGFKVRNMAGRMMVPMITPAFASVAKSYWEKEDKRSELLHRLRTAPAGVSSASG